MNQRVELNHSTFNQATKTSPPKKMQNSPSLSSSNNNSFQKRNNRALIMFHGPEPQKRCLWHTREPHPWPPHNCPPAPQRSPTSKSSSRLCRSVTFFWRTNWRRRKWRGRPEGWGGFDDFFADPKKNKKWFQKNAKSYSNTHTFIFWGPGAETSRWMVVFFFLKYTCIYISFKKISSVSSNSLFLVRFSLRPWFWNTPMSNFFGMGGCVTVLALLLRLERGPDFKTSSPLCKHQYGHETTQTQTMHLFKTQITQKYCWWKKIPNNHLARKKKPANNGIRLPNLNRFSRRISSIKSTSFATFISSFIPPVMGKSMTPKTATVIGLVWSLVWFWSGVIWPPLMHEHGQHRLVYI